MILAWTASRAGGQDLKKKVIYQIVTDRFFNGDSSNDNCAQSHGLFDSSHTNWRLYWGDDLDGIRQKLPYLKGMGVGAIWISPPADNINVNIPDDSGEPTAPYHGYAPRDFMRIEEHFGDCKNSWAAFDRLAAAVHQEGMKLIVDFAANHTNDRSKGERGALYNDGKFMASYDHDPHGYFHHAPGIRNWDDPYQLQYNTLFDLADLNQENPVIDAYLKAAVRKFQEHGADGFRFDAVRHVTWGWQYSLANAAHSYAPSFLFGEWFQGAVGEPLYRDSVKFANQSGMSLLDYPLAVAIRDVFSGKAGFYEIHNTLRAENHDLRWPNDQVTFADNHDLPRLLSLKDHRRRLEEALAFVLSCRGIPVIYYGDEQYLHHDANGGNDPYNRVMMSSWDTTTTAYRLIARLARLRASNDALAYGDFRERWINQDVYVFERRFSSDIVLIAINRSTAKPCSVNHLYTALPANRYTDDLAGLLGGGDITVSDASGVDHPVSAFTLAPGEVAMWSAEGRAAKPEAGSVEPTVGQPGMTVTLRGEGFGNQPGSVWFDQAEAALQSWSSSAITFRVPAMKNGQHQVWLRSSFGGKSDPLPFTVLGGRLIPVTFSVNRVPPLSAGDSVFLTGNTVELGNWSETFHAAVGPLLHHGTPEWFITASMPAGARIRFKFFKMNSGGSVIRESGDDHEYTVPRHGEGQVKAHWED